MRDVAAVGCAEAVYRDGVGPIFLQKVLHGYIYACASLYLRVRDIVYRDGIILPFGGYDRCLPDIGIFRRSVNLVIGDEYGLYAEMLFHQFRIHCIQRVGD